MLSGTTSDALELAHRLKVQTYAFKTCSSLNGRLVIPNSVTAAISSYLPVFVLSRIAMHCIALRCSPLVLIFIVFIQQTTSTITLHIDQASRK